MIHFYLTRYFSVFLCVCKKDYCKHFSSLKRCTGQACTPPLAIYFLISFSYNISSFSDQKTVYKPSILIVIFSVEIKLL
jgi:hypothetical protein